MKSTNETAYRFLPDSFSTKELNEYFSPNEQDIRQLAGMDKPILKTAYFLHLKLFNYLGYFVSLNKIPGSLVAHITKRLKLKAAPSRQQLADYEKSGSKNRHLQTIRESLGVKPFGNEDKVWLETVAHEAAKTKESVNDIINVMLEELVHHCFELPGFTVLQRMARSAKNSVNEDCYRAITQDLTPAANNRLMELLQSSASGETQWNILKREPKQPTNKEVRRYLQHVKWLQTLGEMMPHFSIPIVKRRQFTLEARALNIQELSRLKPTKRLALMVLLVKSQHSKSLDDVAAIFIRILRNMESTAQSNLQRYLLEQQKQVDALIGQFKAVLDAWQQDGTKVEKLDAIDTVIGDKADVLINQCETHMAYAGNNYLPFMLEPYRQKRSLLFNCLTILDLQTTSNDQSTIKLLTLLKALQSSHKAYLSQDWVTKVLQQKLEPKWFPDKWRKLIFDKAREKANQHHIHRKYLELGTLLVIKQELSSADLHIPFSAEYDDYREQLVDDNELDSELATYDQYVELPLKESSAFIAHLKDWLTNSIQHVDAKFPDNVYATIKDGRISLKRKKGTGVSNDVAKLDDILATELSPTSIIDILTDTNKWLDLDSFIFPHSGNEQRIDDPEKRFITTLFCYGCNLGPTQTARSIKGISRRQVSWLNLKHVSEDKLDGAITKVINAYNRFDLPKYWGTGKHASADGTKWDIYEQNLLSEYHIRYGGYGGIGYYHVSDTYIALFSHFIPCGVYEATYILDGLLGNKSDIQPDTVHGDTQAQSYSVFGLSYLLGINLMPRIRNIQDLSLYRPDPDFRCKNIDSLFRGNIDFDLIETHLRDMLKIVISIKKGKISSSTILRRLGTYSRKNKLYFAFKELGKVVRTVFLLRYIDEMELRQTIQAATNKSEEFNGFVKWLFFGGDGVIAENIRHEQRKIIKYNQLVANMVILYNAEKMTTVLKELKGNVKITPEILSGLSPYRMSHINRFGNYRLDLRRKVKPLNYDLKIFV